MKSVYKYFDKRGNLLTPVYKNGKNIINLSFDEVSVGLFDTLQIHILEEVYHYQKDLVNNDKPEIETEFYKLLRYIYENTLNKMYVSIKDVARDIFGIEYIDMKTDLEVQNRIKKYSSYVYLYLDGRELSCSLTELGLHTYKSHFKTSLVNKMKELSFEKKLVTPRGDNASLFFKWTDLKKPDENEIFLFSVEGNNIVKYFNNDLNTERNVWRGLSNTTRFSPAENDVFLDDKKHFNLPYNFIEDVPRAVYSSNITTNTIVINLAINSEEEGAFFRTLDVYRKVDIDEKTINIEYMFTLELEGEVIGEDERFQVMLGNMGRKIDEEDFYVIKSMDIEDDRPDYIKINSKRKELLLEGNEIFTYMGSYKAFHNALKWLEFEDIKVREYFYNTETWRANEFIEYKPYLFDADSKTNWEFKGDKKDKDGNIIDIKNYNEEVFNDIKFDPMNAESNVWKKTTRMGLVWQYNEYTGELDEYDYPIIKNLRDFNPEEMMVKLFGLRKILYKYFLPHNVRIIDITAEGVYFLKFRLLNWNNIEPIKNVRKIPYFKIEVLNKNQKPQNIWSIINSVFPKSNLAINDPICNIYDKYDKSVSEYPVILENNFCETNLPKETTDYLSLHFDSPTELRDFLLSNINNKSKNELCGNVYMNEQISLVHARIKENTYGLLRLVDWYKMTSSYNTVDWQSLYEKLFFISEVLEKAIDFLEISPEHEKYYSRLIGLYDENSDIRLFAADYFNAHISISMSNSEILEKLKQLQYEHNNWKNKYYDYYLNMYSIHQDKLNSLLFDLWEGYTHIHNERRVRWTLYKDLNKQIRREFKKRWKIDYNKVSIPENEKLERRVIYKYFEGTAYDVRDIIIPITERGVFGLKLEVFDDTNFNQIVKDDVAIDIKEEDFDIIAFEFDNEKVVNPDLDLRKYDLDYSRYLDNNMFDSFINSFPLEINDGVLVPDKNFYPYMAKYSKNWDYVYLYKNHKITHSPEEYNIKSTSGSVVILDREVRDELKDKKNIFAVLYNKLVILDDVVIDNNDKKVRVYIKDDILKSKFRVGRTIVLEGDFYVTNEETNGNVVTREAKLERAIREYPIRHVKIDYNTDMVELTLKEDNMLYNRIDTDKNDDYRYNEQTSFNKLILYYDQEIVRVDKLEGSKVYLEYNANTLKRRNFEYIKIDVDSGLVAIPVNDLNNKSYTCRVSNDYEILASPFDLFKGLNGVRNMYFNGKRAFSFYITDLTSITPDNNSYLTINEKRYNINFDGSKHSPDSEEHKQALLNALNNLDTPFRFYLVDDFIKAIEKEASGGFYSVFCNNTNIICYDYMNYGELFFEFDTGLVPAKYPFSNFINPNIYDKKFKINKNTRIFLTVTNKKYFNSYNYNFEWELFDEGDGRVVLCSDKDYLKWRCIRTTNYTVNLTIRDKKSNSVILKEKKNFIFVV